MRRSLLDPLSVRGRQSPARARQVRGVITDHIPCGGVLVSFQVLFGWRRADSPYSYIRAVDARGSRHCGRWMATSQEGDHDET